MTKINIEINLEDLVDDLFATATGDEYGVEPTMSLQEAFKNQVVNSLVLEVKNNLKQDAQELLTREGSQQIKEFVEGELKGIIYRKLRAGELRSRWGGFKTYDELIENAITGSHIEHVIKKHIDAKADKFAKEMRARYDNVFAAKIVGALNDQKMLSPEVAKILLGESDGQ